MKVQTVVLLAAVSAAGTCVLGAEDAVVREEFIFEKAPFKSCHASTIAELPDGTLVAAWFGGSDEGGKDVGIWLSRNVKGSWLPPVEVANGVQYRRPDGTVHRHPCWNPVLFQPRKGLLLLFYKCGPSPRKWWGMLTVSSDGGRTWSVPRRLPEGIIGPVKDKPVELADGTLLCGSSTEDRGWRVHFERTADLGVTWERTRAINSPSEFSAIQPTLLRHGPLRFQALCRTRQNVIAETWTEDGGKTWTKLAAAPLPNPNSGIDGVTLRDGRHVLVYNHTVRSRPSPCDREMLNVAVSPDGKKWFAALTLENERNCEFSYPAVIQARDGKVHITYTWKRLRIKHVVVDPEKLELKPIVNGKWPD